MSAQPHKSGLSTSNTAIPPAHAPASFAGLSHRPIVDLDSRTAVAVKFESPSGSDGHTNAVAHIDQLSQIARQETVQRTPLPLVLPLPATFVTQDADILRSLEHTLRRTGRRPREVTLILGPELRSMRSEPLIRGVARVRALGFRCAFDTASVAPDLLVAAAPFLFAIDADIIAGLPHDERRVAVVEGLARIGHGSGLLPMAAGISTPAQFAKAYEAGIRLACGSLFATEEWIPGDSLQPLPDPPVSAAAHRGEAGAPIAEFVIPPVTMTSEATAEEVLEAFTEDAVLSSVVLVDQRERPVALLDRSRFLLAITGPYGHALHAKRPAQRLAESPRTVPLGLSAMAALRTAGAESEHVHDDLIAINEFGQCTGIVRVGDLIRSISAA